MNFPRKMLQINVKTKLIQIEWNALGFHLILETLMKLLKGSQNLKTELVEVVVEIRFALQLELVVLWLNGNKKLISTTRPDDMSTIRSPSNSFACMYASATKTTTTTATAAAAITIQAVALAQATAVQCDFIGFYYTRATEMPIHHSCGISPYVNYTSTISNVFILACELFFLSSGY